MSQSSRQEIAVGIALTVAVLVLLAGLLWLQEFQLRGATLTVRAVFPTVGGLDKGAPVHVRGIPMGDVLAIELRPTDVLVTMRVDGEVGFTDDARFLVGTQGLVGERFVDVHPGHGEPVRDLEQRVFQGRYEPAATEMVGQLETLTNEVLAFLERADRILADVEESGGLGETVAQTTRAARLAAEMLESSAPGLVSASRSMARAGERLDGFLDEHGDDLDKGAEGLAQAAVRLDSLTTQLAAVADGAADVIAALQEQQGTLGRMIYGEEMGENMEKSVETLRFLLEDIKRNPQRYLTVKVF